MRRRLPYPSAPGLLDPFRLGLLRLEVRQPLQGSQPRQEAVLAAPCDDKRGQALHSLAKRPVGDVKDASAVAGSGDGVLFRASAKKAAIVHPFGLDELELPP